MDTNGRILLPRKMLDEIGIDKEMVLAAQDSMIQVWDARVYEEVALDREFGIDGSIIDCPQENAQVLLVAEYVRKTERYEPRAKVARVEWTGGKAQDGTMTPKVVIEIV